MERINPNKLLTLRRLKDITQEKAANALEISRVTYNIKERTGRFTEDEVSKLSDLLKVEKQDLVQTKDSSPSMPQLRNFAHRLQEERNQMIHEIKRIRDDELQLFLFKFEKSKEEAVKQIEQEIKLAWKSVAENESKYQQKYTVLLEKQVETKDQIIADLQKTIIELQNKVQLQIQEMKQKMNDEQKVLNELINNLKQQLP